MNMGETSNTWLQVRMTQDEKERLELVASSYGMNVSTFVRSVVAYFDERRPNLVITPEGKEAAPAA